MRLSWTLLLLVILLRIEFRSNLDEVLFCHLHCMPTPSVQPPIAEEEPLLQKYILPLSYYFIFYYFMVNVEDTLLRRTEHCAPHIMAQIDI